MFKKNGFTLIEMLAVVTILGIISVLAFPYANNLLKKSKDNEYNRFLDDIYLATEAYLVDNSDNYATLTKEDGVEYVSLEKVVKGGYLKSTTVNPKTGEKIDLNKSVKVTNKNKKYNYALMDKNYDTNAYVSDGLVLMYDISSKPISSSNDFIWKDLSGNNNDVTLKNFSSDINSWYSNEGIIFNGTNNYGIIGTHDYDYVTIYATLSFSTLKASEGVIIANFEVGGYGLTYNIANNKLLNFQPYISTYQQATSNDYAITDTLYNLVGIYDGNTIKLYLNGILQNNLTSSGVIKAPINNTALMLGANPSGPTTATDFTQMNLKQIKLYNRALTEDEIQKNYEIDKERFGL